MTHSDSDSTTATETSSLKPCETVIGPQFVESFNATAGVFHALMREKGFWEKERNVGEQIMLMVTELAEGFEGYRQHDRPDDHCPEYRSIEVELADCIYRIMDISQGMGLRVAEALMAKHEYNKTRPYKHGKTC